MNILHPWHIDKHEPDFIKFSAYWNAYGVGQKKRISCELFYLVLHSRFLIRSLCRAGLVKVVSPMILGVLLFEY